MKTYQEFIVESKISDIQNLQPNTRIEVFHGTTMDTLIEFVGQGVDAMRVAGRSYPHVAGGKKVDRGLFVTPDLKTALRFGRCVIKFTAQGKDLYPMFGTRESLKHPDPEMVKRYPKSFRPATSYDMLDRGVGNESQAIFLGLLSPRAITKIYLMSYKKDGSYISSPTSGSVGSEFERSEFLKWLKEIYFPNRSNDPNKLGATMNIQNKPLVEPQAANTIDLEKFYKELAKEHDIDVTRTKKIIWDSVKKYNALKGVGRISYTANKVLTRRIKASSEYQNYK